MEVLQQIAAVLAVLGLLAGSLWWLRRRGIAYIATPRRRAPGVLQNVERLQLSATVTLHLVRVADRAILIAASPSGCQVVESSPWAEIQQSSPEEHS